MKNLCWRLCNLTFLGFVALAPSRADVIPLVPLPPTLLPITSLKELKPGDSTTWSQLGADQTAIPATFNATSANGVTVTGSFLGDNGGGLVSVVCPTPPAPFPFPCSWTGGNGGKTPFGAKDSLLWTFDKTNYDGPLTLSLSSFVTGAGALIQSEFPGQFTAQVQVGTDKFTEQSDRNGDPIFIGVIGINTSFSSITFSITKCTNPAPSTCDVNDFALDTLYTRGGPVPEPALFVPLAGALAAFVWFQAGRWRCWRNGLRLALLLGLVSGARPAHAQFIPTWTQTIAPCPIFAIVEDPEAPGTAVLPPCGTRDAKSHMITMVGRNPFLHGHILTNVPTLLVSVKLTFPNGDVYDPTVATGRLKDINGVAISVQDATVNSPIFEAVNVPWMMNGVNVGSGVAGGALQYGDAFQRANFWQYVGGTPQQTVLSPLTVGSMAVNVPAGMGISKAKCDPKTAPLPCGYAAFAWWDPVAQNYITSVANSFNMFVIFLFDSVELYYGTESNMMGILAGYHSSFIPNDGFDRTYAVADFDTSGILADAPDVEVLSHEVGEWLDDPIINSPTLQSGEGGVGGNQVAAWGPYGQQSGCQKNLEVGDPSSQPTPKPPAPVKGPITPKPFVVMLNNFNYHLQELNYFSWFLGANAKNPSIAAGGGFSNNGSFASDAGPVCK